MITEIGHFSLLLALALAVIQSIVPLVGAARGDHAMMRTAIPAAHGQFVFVAAAFAALTYAYVTSDFSVSNVFENSHSAKPMLYKVAGVWGNHEGSMLLWVLILALFGAMVASFGANLAPSFRARVLAVQGLIGVAFLLFIVATSNPFIRLDPAPADGSDLNPLLQDPGLAFHPPFLYLGYVGFSMAFAFAVAALIEGRVDAAWARWVRPWTLAAWAFLTVGIAMGSWWAYYELGWGGWWFWDPVENASFLPWLAGTALLHCALVVEKRDTLKVWTVLLAIIAFSLSLVGTFLVRSGVLTSVHAFAVDPDRGVFILAILALFIGGALALYAWRAPTLRGGGLFAPVSREGALVVNNLLLTIACAAVFIGTLYPLVLEAVTGAKISVGAPYFDLVFTVIMVPLLVIVPFGPYLAWKRGDLLGTAQRLLVALLVAVLGTITAYAVVEGRGPVLAPLGIGLGLWLIAGAISEICWRTRVGKAPVTESLRRAANLPRSSWGTMLAHAGVGVVVLGITGVTAWKTEVITRMQPGDAREVAGFTVAYEGIAPRRGPNYNEAAALFTITSGGAQIGTIESAKRLYDVQRMATTEAGIMTFFTGDLYIAIGDEGTDGLTVRIWYNPLVPFIWFGAIVVSLGGLLSLTDRRLRIGAPRRAGAKSAVAEAGAR